MAFDFQQFYMYENHTNEVNKETAKMDLGSNVFKEGRRDNKKEIDLDG